MKSLTKRMGVLATVIAIAVIIIVGSSLIFNGNALADTDTDYSYKYYYNQISVDPMAEKFYKAFESLANSGELKKGSLQYDLISNGVVSKDAVEAYVNGKDNNKLVKAYGAGRDAFYMDHPDLFYFNLFSTSISAGMKGGQYVAYLDSSRVLSTYMGASINSETLVNNAIKEYNNKINQIVDEAKALGSDKEKIEFVNKYISEHNKYGYGTKVEGNRNVDTPKAEFIYTSYGAIVNNESVCEGYAKSFKAVMDRLNIPCVCVAGFADGSGKGEYEPHTWNYVQVDGMWYAVDVTYNATSGKVKWMLVGGQTMFDTHIEDNVVSTSGYELRYPAIKPYDFGVDSDDNGMEIKGSYKDSSQGKLLTVSVSYEGKGAKILQSEGKYLVYRYKYQNNGNMEWSAWANIVAINEAYGADLYPITDTDTKIEVATAIESIQFAIINRLPDSVGGLHTGDSLVAYTNLSDSDFIVKPTEPYRNNGFGSYEPSPGAAGVYPSNSGDLPVDRTYEIKITYNTKLETTEGVTADTVGMDYTVSRGAETVKQHAVLENVKWDGDRTITFTFTPSRMYIHNLATYYFTPVGLVGANSKKVPDSVAYTFKGKSVVCSKVFNDGRLYMSVYGEPSLLDNSDLSVTDFKDENGNYFAESQRSQLILVANKTSDAKTAELDGILKDNTAIKDDEIVSSSTYEIDLQICGVVQKVPNGSYMQVAFGFPEGYSPDDAGTTFQIYHYKHDDKGNITGVEEIPVIITQYGLIAKVTSFSPFTIVQIKNTSGAVKNSNTANIYAYVNGAGGTISSDGKSGISQVKNKITYDIKPDDGYTIAYVRLNGKVVDPSNYKDGKLTLAKKNIDSSNMLEVSFMSQDFANTYADLGINLSFGEKSDFKASKSNVVGIVIGCLVAVLAIVAVVVAVWFVMKKKKMQPATAVAGAGKSVKTNTVKSTKTTPKQTKTAPIKSVSAPNTAASKTESASKSAESKSAPKTTTATAKTSSTSKSASKPTSAVSTPTASKATPVKSTSSTAKKTSATSKPTASKPTSTSKSSATNKSTAAGNKTANKSTSAKNSTKTASKSSTTKKK